MSDRNELPAQLRHALPSFRMAPPARSLEPLSRNIAQSAASPPKRRETSLYTCPDMHLFPSPCKNVAMNGRPSPDIGRRDILRVLTHTGLGVRSSAFVSFARQTARRINTRTSRDTWSLERSTRSIGSTATEVPCRAD